MTKVAYRGKVWEVLEESAMIEGNTKILTVKSGRKTIKLNYDVYNGACFKIEG